MACSVTPKRGQYCKTSILEKLWTPFWEPVWLDFGTKTEKKYHPKKSFKIHIDPSRISMQNGSQNDI
jgi:hypothetical protein